MGNSRGLWIVGGVLLAGAIFWGVGQAVGPSSGDAEFQKALEAMKQVKSFRGAYMEASGAQNPQKVWEVDCNRVIVHEQSQFGQNSMDGSEMKEDELLVGEQRYIRDGSGGWENGGYAGERFSAKWYCENIARGTVRDLMPDIRTLISHGITEKGDKKTVNGARCREWKFDQRTVLSSRVGSICIGVDDHLPYELTMDGGRYLYSDYNQPIQFEAPEAVLQQASSN